MQVIEHFAAMGPWAYFGLMAVLPLFWFPLSPFLLFAPAFGLKIAILGSLCALTANMIVSWLVSGKWFRPVFVRLVARFGYSIPEFSERRMLGIALMLRLTPGVPFALQNYLLGLAQMPFGRYLLASLPIIWTVSASFIVLGESLMTGNLKLAVAGVGLAIAIAILLRFLRGRLQAKSIAEGSNNGA